MRKPVLIFLALLAVAALPLVAQTAVVDQITGMVGKSALETSINKALSGEGSARPFVVS